VKCHLRLQAVLLTCLTLGAAALALPAHATTVWAIDDGEKIGRDALSLPFKSGVDNPVWAPGKPIRLIGMRDEVVAFQVVVEADGVALDGVTVDVALEGSGAAIRVERFIEHFLEIRRPSSTAGSNGSLDWLPGSGPPPDRFKGWVPDALIPVEVAPPWAPWPMRLAAGQNAVVWIDLTIPPDLSPGTYRGEAVVRAPGNPRLAGLPIKLEILPATMPARPVGTMLYYAPEELARRIGDRDQAERQLWELFHRHRVVPVHAVGSPEDVRSQLPALDGSAYTPSHGYEGPAVGIGDDLVVIGMYGSFGDASDAKLAAVERIADELGAHGLFDSTDVVFYAEDEDCRSPRGTIWSDRIKNSPNLNARRVRLAWTCSEDPASQPVDVPIVLAGEYDAATVAAARAVGKTTWIYNGQRPATGSTLTDAEANSMRTFGWIAAMAGIPRWFIWETTFWYDDHPGGHGPYDPFVTAETFHNKYREAAMGGGVLVYPGRQVDRFGEHSLGLLGVIPSIRLKNLRRGIQDAGYLQLARAAAPVKAARIARSLMPAVLGEAVPGSQPSWGDLGKTFFEARRALAALIAPGVDPDPDTLVGAAAAATAGIDPGPDTLVGARMHKSHFRLRWRWRLLAAAFVISAGAFVHAWRQTRNG
jgi:hypothetical protein